MKRISNIGGKEKIISQIGDSTDEEDGNVQHNISEFHKYLNSTYSISSILKNIGNHILQTQEVRTQYNNIKSRFTEDFIREIPDATLDKYKTWDKELGGCWGVIVSKFNKDNQEVLPLGASRYFDIRQSEIERTCRDKQGYSALTSNAQKANYHLKHVVKIQDKLNEIYEFNKKAESCAQNQRKDLEPIFRVPVDTSESSDASSFLAKGMAIEKLDKDLGKNYLYDYKVGTGRAISNISIATKTTQQNETLQISKGSSFTHYITDEGNYTNIGQRLQYLIDKNLIAGDKLSEFLKASLREQKYNNIFTPETLSSEARHIGLMDELTTLVKLVFEVEIKRNKAALLTNAMFFELVSIGKYKIEDIATKLPMAMQGAVPASVYVDNKMGMHPKYDYRSTMQKSKADELFERDKKILNDWFLYKCGIDKAIQQLRQHSTIEDLENCNLYKGKGVKAITTERDKTQKIKDKNITVTLDSNKFTLHLIWNNNKAKFEVHSCKIEKIQGKYFAELIKEWYGINLPYLINLITLKAAAEPEDPKEDRNYQEDFKVLAIDAAPEAELSEYKQKYVTNHSKAKSALKKVDFNKTTIIDEISREIQEAAYNHITSKELVEGFGSKFVISGNKSSEEIISALEAIYETLSKDEKFIGSNRLNLKDKNKHHTEGNVLSTDDLFNEVLNSVNVAAQETHKEDILTTLKEYYYDHQEQISTLGENGNMV